MELRISSSQSIERLKSCSGVVSQLSQKANEVAHHYVCGIDSGVKNAKRYAEIHQFPRTKTCLLMMKWVCKKAKPRMQDVPYILTTAGLFSPIPVGSVLGFGLGKAICAVVNLFKKIKL